MIKLWIADIREDISWNDLIKAANKAEARAKIPGSTHLDKCCLKGKRPWKISLNTCDDQAKKTKATPPQIKASPSVSDQSKVIIKAKEKVRKEKKRRKHQKSKIDKKDKTIALLQWELIPLRLQKAKKRSNTMAKALKRTSPRSSAITIIRKTTTPGITPSQKTSCSLGNFYISDY